MPGWVTALRPEDGVLVAWLGVLAPAAALAVGPNLAEGPLGGAAMVVATLLVVVCLATRPADQPGVRLMREDRTEPRWIIAGPLVGAVSLISSTGFRQLGMTGIDLGGIVLIVAVAAIVLNRWLPVLPTPARRLLVMPFMLVATTYFNGLTADLLGAIEPDAIVAAFGTPEWSFTAFVAIMVIGGLAVLYAMLIVAPRQLADPEDAGFRWVVRFVLFLVASLAGIGWLTLIG